MLSCYTHMHKKKECDIQTRKSKCTCVFSVVKRNVSSNRSTDFLRVLEVKHQLLRYLLMTKIDLIKKHFFSLPSKFCESSFPHLHRLICSQSDQTAFARRAKQNPHKPNCTSLSFLTTDIYIHISEKYTGNSKKNYHFPFLFKCSTESQHCTNMNNDRNKQSNTVITAKARMQMKRGYVHTQHLNYI